MLKKKVLIFDSSFFFLENFHRFSFLLAFLFMFFLFRSQKKKKKNKRRNKKEKGKKGKTKKEKRSNRKRRKKKEERRKKKEKEKEERKKRKKKRKEKKTKILPQNKTKQIKRLFLRTLLPRLRCQWWRIRWKATQRCRQTFIVIDIVQNHTSLDTRDRCVAWLRRPVVHRVSSEFCSAGAERVPQWKPGTSAWRAAAVAEVKRPHAARRVVLLFFSSALSCGFFFFFGLECLVFQDVKMRLEVVFEPCCGSPAPHVSVERDIGTWWVRVSPQKRSFQSPLTIVSTPGSSRHLACGTAVHASPFPPPAPARCAQTIGSGRGQKEGLQHLSGVLFGFLGGNVAHKNQTKWADHQVLIRSPRCGRKRRDHCSWPEGRTGEDVQGGWLPRDAEGVVLKSWCHLAGRMCVMPAVDPSLLVSTQSRRFYGPCSCLILCPLSLLYKLAMTISTSFALHFHRVGTWPFLAWTEL